MHTLYTQTWGPVAQRIIKYLPIFHKRNWIDWIQQFGSVPKIITFLLFFLDTFKSPKSMIHCIFIQFHKSISDFEIFSNRLCSISDILISSCFFLRWSIEHDKNTGLLMTSTCLWAHTGLLSNSQQGNWRHIPLYPVCACYTVGRSLYLHMCLGNFQMWMTCKRPCCFDILLRDELP